MIKINRKVEYTLMVLKFMSERGSNELTTAREVCDRYKAPFDTIAKVMQQLNMAAILVSIKGVKGGYYLNFDLSKLSVLALVELIEGKSFTVDCHDGPCELLSTCNITTPIRRLNDYVTSIFSTLTVSELLAENAPSLKLAPQCPSFKEHA
jgi:Rrf2 family protein